MRQLAIILLLLTIMPWTQGSAAEMGEVLILWPGTDAFSERVADLPISIEEAHSRLVEKTRDHPARYFDARPIFIVGDDYFFSDLSKVDVPLKGFYVNGRTGAIEYRDSVIAIVAHAKTLPPHAFTRIEPID